MNRLEIHVTVSVDEVLRQRPARAYINGILRACLKILERHTGSRLMISVPQSLQLFATETTETWGSIDTIYNLQSLGIIKNFSKRKSFSDEPPLFAYTAQYSDARYASGVDFLSEKKAAGKAIGEAIERHLWGHSNFFSSHKIIKTYKEIQKRALNIFSLAGFSEKQKKKHPGLQFTEETPFAWIYARSLTSGTKILCPIQLVSSLYFWKNVKTPWNKDGVEPMLRWCITTGLATGKSLEEAIVAGMLEVIEREAFMIAYLNKLSPPIINLEHLASQDEEVGRVLRKFKRYNLEVHLVTLPTDFPVHVVLAIIRDHSGRGPAMAVGASADFNLKTCLLDALSESTSVRHSIKNTYKNPIHSKHIGRKERLMYWAKQENSNKINFFTRGKKINIHLKESVYAQSRECRHDKKQLEILVQEFRRQNEEVCYVELSLKETKFLGFRTVFVVAPGLQPMHLEEEIPYFGGERLKTVPEKLGYKPAKELNKEPHPFP